VVVAGDDEHPDAAGGAATARIAPSVWRAVQQGLTRGPVLVQVPRTGYVPAAACQTCRRPARCPHCAGPVRLPDARAAHPQEALGTGAPGTASPGTASPGTASPDCGWCGRTLPGWACPHCGGRQLRASRVGVQRTAEELGRAFPSAPVVVSRADRQLPVVADRPAIVLATPGVEPVPAHGYAAAVLLDGDAMLSRADLRAGEDALRRWRAAAALVRPATEGGLVVVSGDPGAPAVQALVRADPAGFASRELAERAGLGLPPSVTAVTLVGVPDAVAALLRVADLPAGATVLGPVPVETTGRPAAPVAEPLVRTLVRVPLPDGPALAAALHAASAVRSAKRETGPVRVQVDARDLG
jgi:primosomal protein N' (replication factor Y)